MFEAGELHTPESHPHGIPPYNNLLHLRWGTTATFGLGIYCDRFTFAFFMGVGLNYSGSK